MEDRAELLEVVEFIENDELVEMADKLRFQMDDERMPELFFGEYKDALVRILLELEQVEAMSQSKKRDVKKELFDIRWMFNK